MTLTNYEIVYIIMNLFRTYVIFKYLCIFYDREDVNKKIEFASYSLFYILITVLYLTVNIPIIMLFSNLIGFHILSFNYKANLKQRVLSTLLIYIILLCIESIVSLVTGYVDFPVFSENYYSSVLGIVIIQIFSYIIALVLQNYKKIKSGKTLSTSYWIGIFTIPLLSLYIIVSLFYVKGLSISQLLISIIFLFLLNVLTFSFYDKTIEILENKMVSRMLTQMNNYYQKQFEIMKSSIDTTRSVRHDLKNHLYVMQMLLHKNDNDKLNEYLSEILQSLDKKIEYLNTGNVIIDSIFNFKLQESEHKKINLNYQINVPDSLMITSFDMTVILGNLLDNAMNAVNRLDEDKRKIDISITYSKGVLKIEMKNSFDGLIKHKGNKIVTSNKDEENHGIGLTNVKNTIEKYNGKLEIDYTQDQFYVYAMIYVKAGELIQNELLEA